MKYEALIVIVAFAFVAFAMLGSGTEKALAEGPQGSTPSEMLPAPSRTLLSTGTAGKPGAAGTATAAALPPWADSPPFSSHDYASPLPETASPGLEVAILAGGCFWCLEAVYELIPGVKDVVSGYAGGQIRRPSYEQVSTGLSGHAEAVRIVFDPKVVTYRELLDYFWKIHDPTTKDRQGYDVGPQYRSAIFYVNDGQRTVAEASMKEQAALWPKPIVTQLQPAKPFWIAEEYHQDFYRRNPDYGYCAVVVAPKLKKAGFAD